MFGLRIFSNPMCVQTVVTWHVERHSTRKRRRNWRVVRHEESKPCAYRMADGSMAMHPTLYAQLTQQAKGADHA